MFRLKVANMMDVVGQQGAEERTETFGPYRIVAKIGSGGMATVHRASQHGIEGFRRTVALKRLHPEVAARGDFVKMFIREASLASKLQHPNVVQLFDLGQVDGTYFISMELVDGWSLGQIIRQAQLATEGPLPINVTVALLIQACDALHYAHHAADENGRRLNLIHRDVSPANLLVSRNGHLKVIDFGIARADHDDSNDAGMIKGKFGYLAPELLSGGSPGIPTDTFALGVVAHELLTGHRLFHADNDLQTIENILYNDPAPPSQRNLDCPAELDAIVLNALARLASDRTAGCDLLRDELTNFRRRHNLNASHIEVSAWLERAFDDSFAGGRRADTSESFKWATNSNQHRFPKGTITDNADSADSATDAIHPRFGYYADVEITNSDELLAPTAKELPTLAGSDDGDLDAMAIARALPPRELKVGGKLVSARDSAAILNAQEVMVSGPAPTTPFASLGLSVTPATKSPANQSVVLRVLPWLGVALIASVLVLGVLWVRSNTNAQTAEVSPTGLKFAVEPSDALIKIAGMTPMPPGDVDLEPGIYSIAVEREGFQTWNSTINLNSGEFKNVSVAMTALSSLADEADHAPTIEISSSPPGLLIAIDRLITKHKTPASFRLETGEHRISLVGTEGDVWSTTIIAKPDHRYEFSPSISREQLEPKEHVASREQREARERDSVAKKLKSSKSASPTNSIEAAQLGDSQKTAVPILGPGVLSSDQASGLFTIAPPPTTRDSAKQKPAVPSKPRVIVARDVVRVSGKFPAIRQNLVERAGSSRSGAVLLCISPAGRVTSAKALNSQLPAEVNTTFVKAARKWRYKPYRENGVAVRACFSVVFRLRSSR